MKKLSNPFNAQRSLSLKSGKQGYFYSLPALEEAGLGKISRLPISVRIVLESLLRNCTGDKITEEDVRSLAKWDGQNVSKREIPFVVARILLQDFTGVPLLVDLAAMRDAAKKMGRKPELIEPLVPVDLVIDHSIQVDRFGNEDALKENIKLEFERNKERYEFLKWGQQAFETFRVVPPGIGIVHQVNLEYLAKCVFSQTIDEETIFYPDTLVGTDSHTTMINGLGIVGWGVGGIEAEAGMLGQPIYISTPEVIGVCMTGSLKEGVTATDLTLYITEFLRKEKVVGKFVEYFGEGAASLSVADRATIANMAPEYGATIGFFPIDEKTIEYMAQTGRSKEQLELIEEYYKAQGMWGVPGEGMIDYTKVLKVNLSEIVPCVSGPKRPQDRIDITDLKNTFLSLLEKNVNEGGYGKSKDDLETKIELKEDKYEKGCAIGHGSILLASITSCTNTSNPSVMIAAGLLAKKAVERGLKVSKSIKTSLSPGSRVVSDYLEKTGLQEYLDKLGFNVVGYGCMTCIGNSGPLDSVIEKAVHEGNLVAASVLSGNRNFEARVHPVLKANFLMSPPLVVAYALAGRLDINLSNEPLGIDTNGDAVYMRDIWPSNEEIKEYIARGITPEMFRSKYNEIDEANPEWNAINTAIGNVYDWKDSSTYIQEPPFFENFKLNTGFIKPIEGMRPLAIFGDSVTTDHISPAGSIPESSPTGLYLKSKGVERKDFNSFGSRRGNDRIMTRGTFGNIRIKNLLGDGKEGGITKLMPEGKEMAIFDACEIYKERRTPLIVFAGADYGMGSSRDWAAKGTFLLGVKAVVAHSFERIHRSNLVGMGVLPLQFKDGDNPQKLSLDGSEVFSIEDLNDEIKPRQELTLKISRANDSVDEILVLVRIDTETEIEYYRHGGILPYVLRNILTVNNSK